MLEFGDDALSQPAYTVPGRLVGHLILGRDLVREAALKQGDVNPELLQMLEHIILTHLALPEWGSPRLPLIPECLIVHHADDLDAKLEMYARCLSRDRRRGRSPTAIDLGSQFVQGTHGLATLRRTAKYLTRPSGVHLRWCARERVSIFRSAASTGTS